MWIQQLFDFFSGKAKTRIYTSFLGWILIFHIDILFIAIFTDQTIIFEKTSLLKGEYIWWYITKFGWWTIVIEIIRLASATLVTYLMIWVVPKLINEKAYKEELAIEYSLRKMKIKEEEALNEREQDAVKKQLENIQTEEKIIAKRAKLNEKPEQIKWDAEFDDFIKIRNGPDTLQEISNTVYAEGGNLYQYKDANGWTQSPTGVKAANLELADTNGLVGFNEKGKMLALTDKGKYFIKKQSSL